MAHFQLRFSVSINSCKHGMLFMQLKNGTADITLGIADLLAIAPVSNFPWAQTPDAWETLAYRQLLVVANVTETLTGTVLSGNSTVQFTSNKYSLSFLDITPSSYKPGLTFVGFVSKTEIHFSWFPSCCGRRYSVNRNKNCQLFFSLVN